ncbi:MAG: hypothetical protein Q9195_004177 [Heterodermia aff. obscurata]
MSDITSLKNAPEDSQLITSTKQPRLISNKHDPVQRLPLETIANIICYLEAEDTESLRRLSKSWKNASEAFNTKEAILRHFPRSSCPPLATGPQYKLYFRRLLYHNSSLKRGRATRSHYFSDVSTWSLRSNKLVLMGQKNGLSIYDLASPSGIRLEAKHCVLNSTHGFPVNEVLGETMSITSHGEIVVRFRTWQRGTVVVKISTDLTRQRSVAGYWNVVTVGTDHFYGLNFTNGTRDITARMVTGHLDTGAEISHITIAGSFPVEVHEHSMLEAIITSNEQILILKNYKVIFGLIDVLSGKMVDAHGPGIPTYVTSISIFLHPESPDFTVSTNEFQVYDYVYDAELAAYNVSLVSEKNTTGGRCIFSVALAPDLPNHQLVMRRGQTNAKKLEGTWEFSVKKSSTWKQWNLTTPSREGRAYLLAPRLGGPGERDAPARTRDYLGQSDGFLVHHDAVYRKLMVADFWPSW